MRTVGVIGGVIDVGGTDPLNAALWQGWLCGGRVDGLWG
jgi:hypothetical protein